MLDGAVGTELDRQGYDITAPLWSARPMLSCPGVVTDIHEAYVRAGADVVTANTFRTTPRAFREAGLSLASCERAVFAAVECARLGISRAVAGEESHRAAEEVIIAGSVAPIEDCYRPDLVPERARLIDLHSQQVTWLVAAGVDVILVETMNRVDELQEAVRVAGEAGVPVWASVTCDETGAHLLSGEPIAAAVEAAVDAGAAVVGVNCLPIGAVARAVETLVGITDRPVLAYPNVGSVSADGRWRPQPPAAAHFGEQAARWIAAGATIVGGCCGTRVEHVSAIRSIVDKVGLPA